MAAMPLLTESLGLAADHQYQLSVGLKRYLYAFSEIIANIVQPTVMYFVKSLLSGTKNNLVLESLFCFFKISF